jgi:hypothetical protein
LWFKASLGKQFERLYLKKPFTKIGLVEWLKVKALSSSPSKTKKKSLAIRGNTLYPQNPESANPNLGPRPASCLFFVVSVLRMALTLSRYISNVM